MTTEFRDALSNAGIPYANEIIADGKLHRYKTDGDHAENCWYVLHDDSLPAGAFGCWKRGLSETWCAFSREALSEEEEKLLKTRIEMARAERLKAETENRDAARTRAAEIWNAATPAVEHDYLTKKKIKPHGARVHGGRLVLPMRDAAGILYSLQFIDTNGEKRFLSGGHIKNCYFSIGTTQGVAVLCIAEGFATGATIHEATGYPVAVAFNAGNLLPVARALRAKFPDLRLILCADDDHRTESNPGKTKATEAAQAVGGLLAVPDFGSDRLEGATDFNDLHHAQGLEAVRRCIDAALSSQAEQPAASSVGGIEFRCLDNVEAKPINWLWPGKIARGKVTMLAGNPGLGKSQVTASMAAIVTTGGQWPVDRSRCVQGSVVFLSAEDDAADTIKPRLMAAGANLKRVFILDAVLDGFDAQGKPTPRQFNLRTDLTRLSALLDRLGDVALIVIDPITAYLGDTDSHKNAEVRALLAPLGELAAKHSAAVVCVSHLNKGGSSEALMRVTGSLAFVAAARAAFLVARDPDDSTRRLFLPLKNNIGKDESGLAFGIESHQLPGGIETSCIAWEAEAVTVKADEALVPEGSAEDRTERQEAAEWLQKALADGPLSAQAVKEQAEQAGIAWATVRRAKDTLGIKPAKTRFDGGWEWALPSKVLKSTEDAHVKSVSTLGEVEHLRAVTDDAEVIG